MKTLPKSVFITFILISIDGLFWLGFAVLTAAGFIPSIPAGAMRWTMALLALGCAAFMGGIIFLLWKRKRFAFYFAAALLGGIAVLSLMDQIGLLDILSFLVNLAALVLLLKDRGWYLSKGNDHV